ncbi:3-phosphoshikimate 1-carboxyvinyltransferase [Pandoraea thiooxydans]|uniref:3-phosphoshikimate 1-carboxyvinyltransferase n=1 Tax=Pandoraea thiooxydans TaxID=445709 RepID=A0A0G3ENM4_9BURK|nr:3-phosphoshikimate 1-carboxyvinyltransferase [Pandoraea thiooxydans]AKJ68683.1 3-phosphoshikimate 1-carboxyvinyltransferase [Pandoraea thiooxydans]APR96118.1 3-phosphoshikimate 1-carboxyvinyltransferase [Pandoraea thiooxydans]
MTNFLDLGPFSKASGTIKLPGSKSISNRVLLLAALSQGVTVVHDLLASDDTHVMLEALRTLGVRWDQPGDGSTVVHGAGGDFPVKQATLFMGNAGTAIRPLTAALALNRGDYRLSGVPRMHERPIGDLVDGLRQIGARIDYTGQPGFPPLHIHAADVQLHQVPIRVRGDVSSQFLTALLMAAPLLSAAGDGVEIVVDGELISKPYIDITLRLMSRFGVQVQRDGWQRFTVPGIAQGGGYRSPGTIHVEGDASSASYFLAAGAIGGGPVTVEGVGRDSIQGDIRFVDALEQMGARITLGEHSVVAHGVSTANGKLRAIDMDFNHIPDAAMTIAVAALFADGTSYLRNIGSWRVKETDRLTAMATELRKLGAAVDEGADFLRITPPAKLRRDAAIDTYDDHRMAMCFSLASLGGVPVRINDPGCVAKTFPDYFAEFSRIVD